MGGRERESGREGGRDGEGEREGGIKAELIMYREKGEKKWCPYIGDLLES